VFSNLLDNAVKYTPPGTHIYISASSDGPFVRVTVDDDGPGLPPGDPAQLFEKFRRGEREATVVGAGLGLAICRAIVQAHGGTIVARRRPERGTRFEFTLPVAETDA
jgi:two-component system sensor histidine kinase KdpD